MRRGSVLTLAPATLMHELDGAAGVNALRDVATGLMNPSPQVVIVEESTAVWRNAPTDRPRKVASEDRCAAAAVRPRDRGEGKPTQERLVGDGIFCRQGRQGALSRCQGGRLESGNE